MLVYIDENGEWFEIFCLISTTAIHLEALDCYTFHNISKHISIFVFHNFCLMFFGLFAGFLKITAPGWGFSTIFLPQGSGFCTFFVPGCKEFALSKNSPAVCPGGGGRGKRSGLELLIHNMSLMISRSLSLLGLNLMAYLSEATRNW